MALARQGLGAGGFLPEGGVDMPNHNAEVAAVFSKIADLLEIENANPFRVRAYRNAGRLIQGLSRDLREMVGRGEDLRFDAHSRFDFDHLRWGSCRRAGGG